MKGKPPIIYAGATGPKMLDMAVRFADGTMFSDITDADAAGLHGQPPREPRPDTAATPKSFRVNNFCAFHVKEDREASFREARRELMLRGWLGEEWYEPLLTRRKSRESCMTT